MEKLEEFSKYERIKKRNHVKDFVYNDKEKMCTGKKQYVSEAHAIWVCRQITRDKLRPYYCRFCHKYHITSSFIGK
jgi:hypothetical protein